MNLEDLIKLAGVTKSPYDTPVQEQPTEIEEQPVMDDNEGMRALIALVTPEQLNQLQGQAPVEEEGFANSGDEYAGEPEEFKGTLGSPADLSLRRYLGANGVPVNVDETKVYEDHKVEDINEAWQSYKLNERPSDSARNFVKKMATKVSDPMGGMGEPSGPAPAPKVGEPVPGIRQPSQPDPIIDPSAGDPVGEPIPEPRGFGGPDGSGTGNFIIDPSAGEPSPAPAPEPKDPMGGMGEPSGPTTVNIGTRPPDAIGPTSTPKATPATPATPAKPKAPEVTDQMRADAQRYADEVGLPMDQIGALVGGTVGGIATTLEVGKDGTVTDMKTGDIIGGDDAEAARAKAGIKSESLQRIEYLAGLNESYVMERPSDRSRRGTRPPDAIGPGIIQPKVGEPVPEPREPKPAEPAIIDPSAGDPVMPGISSADLDGDMPAEPSQPMPGIDPEDLDGDMPADPDTPDMGKDVFGRDKAALAKADAMFKKYGLTPPRSALMQSADEETNEANAFIKAKIDAEEAGEDEFEVDGKKYKVREVNEYLEDTQESVNEGGMKQAEIEVQDWANKYNEYLGVNGDELANGYLQAMMNTGIMSDAFDQDEYIAFNEKNGYEDDGDWSEDDHDKFMQSSPITRGMFSEIRAIQEKYGIDEQGVNDIIGYFESVNRMKTLAGV